MANIRYLDAGSPGYRWMLLAEQYVVDQGLSTPLQTRALALVAAAILDATIAGWDSKYAYNRKHPSDLDPTVALVVAVPLSPSYPSEHAAAADAAAAVLAYLFPDQAANLAEMANRAATSRVIAGVAFPSDVLADWSWGRVLDKLSSDMLKPTDRTKLSPVPSRQRLACGAARSPSRLSRAHGSHACSERHATSVLARRPHSGLPRQPLSMRRSRISPAQTLRIIWRGSGSQDSFKSGWIGSVASAAERASAAPSR